ncbi:hypothetical protein [Microtetraspora malaysiensis]|uniref:hypothetical protein n=1 Tax=Microtetraspora malaysiensis TaxID=161358 RepID=UPI003D8B7613
MPGNDTYQRLIALLDTTETPYLLIDHESPGPEVPAAPKEPHRHERNACLA